MAADAPGVTCPLLFLAQQEDQLSPLAGVIDLFGRLGATDKRLYLNTGTHGDVPAEAYTGSVRFLTEKLRS